MKQTIGLVFLPVFLVACGDSDPSAPVPIGAMTGGDATDPSTGGTGPHTGSGGTNGSTGGSASGGAGAAEFVYPQESSFAENGFGDNGTWSGYIYDYTIPGGDEEQTASYTFDTTGSYFCATGSTGADWTFGQATFGWNLNQPSGAEQTVESLCSPTEGGLRVVMAVNSADALFKIKLGDSVTNKRNTCAEITVTAPGIYDRVIPWSEFQDWCDDGGGTPLDPTKFTNEPSSDPDAWGMKSAEVVVKPRTVGGMPQRSDFDFCLLNIEDSCSQ